MWVVLVEVDASGGPRNSCGPAPPRNPPRCMLVKSLGDQACVAQNWTGCAHENCAVTSDPDAKIKRRFGQVPVSCVAVNEHTCRVHQKRAITSVCCEHTSLVQKEGELVCFDSY